jgi:hypothetical protein
MSTGYEPTLDDWLALLGLTETVGALKDGGITVAAALQAVDDLRATWPDVHADYVSVLDATARWMTELRAVIAEQNRGLAALRDDLEEMVATLPPQMRPPRLAVPDDRLLNGAERTRLRNLPDELREIEGLLESWAEQLEERAEWLADLAEEAFAEQEGDDD